jgi:hypothetical protein
MKLPGSSAEQSRCKGKIEMRESLKGAEPPKKKGSKKKGASKKDNTKKAAPKNEGTKKQT